VIGVTFAVVVVVVVVAITALLLNLENIYIFGLMTSVFAYPAFDLYISLASASFIVVSASHVFWPRPWPHLLGLGLKHCWLR